MPVVAVSAVGIVAALGALFIYVSSHRSPGDPGVLVWTGIVGAIYFGLLLMSVLLMRSERAYLTDPWFGVAFVGPVVVWVFAVIVALGLRRRSRRS